jgi:hypothetical protein
VSRDRGKVKREGKKPKTINIGKRQDTRCRLICTTIVLEKPKEEIRNYRNLEVKIKGLRSRG